MVDYIRRLHDDLAEQFKDKATIEALNRTIGRQLNEVRQYFEDLRDKRGIDTAVGKQLDGVGDLQTLPCGKPSPQTVLWLHPAPRTPCTMTGFPTKSRSSPKPRSSSRPMLANIPSLPISSSAAA